MSSTVLNLRALMMQASDDLRELERSGERSFAAVWVSSKSLALTLAPLGTVNPKRLKLNRGKPMHFRW